MKIILREYLNIYFFFHFFGSFLFVWNDVFLIYYNHFFSFASNNKNMHCWIIFYEV